VLLLLPPPQQQTEPHKIFPLDDNPQKARPFRVALVARDLLEEVIWHDTVRYSFSLRLFSVY
jgi:hypothetical protein